MRTRPVRLIYVLVLLALFMGAVSYLRILDNYELILLDLRFQARPSQKVNPQIAIVEISDDTLTNLGRWPLPRDYHASLIKVLSVCGVKAIIFDVLFSEPAETDKLLVEASKQAGCVYYPYALNLQEKRGGFWQATKYQAQLLPALEEVAKATGHANVLADIDGKRRRIPLFINYQGRFLRQLSLQAAADYLGLSPEEVKLFPGRSVQLGKICRIPIDEEAAALVNLAGPWKDTFQHYSYYDILAAYAQRLPGESLPPLLAQLKDKVCFVGLTATGTADLNPTALEPVYPMIGLQANLFNSIVTGSFLRRLPRWINLVILYLLCLLNLFLAFKTRPPLSIVYRLGLLILFVGTGFLLFYLAGLWIDLFFPILAYILIYLGANLFRYIKELRRRELLEKELSIARDIQRSFLNDVPEKLPGAEIAAAMETARHVGGDLYDFVRFPDGRVGLMVGDVSGKGVPAALFMAQVISRFRSFTNICSTAAETLTRLNQEISRTSKSGLFVTMAYLIYDFSKAEISFASAGHLPPLVFRDSQLLAKIEVSEGIPLGLMEEAKFEERQLKLQQKDLLLLYTDGLTEARDKRGREFEEAGIIQGLNGRQNLTSEQAIQALMASLKAFVGRTPPHDDITILALQVI